MKKNNSNQTVKNAIEFKYPKKTPLDIPNNFKSDIHHIALPVDSRLANGFDEWGCGWKSDNTSSIGICHQHPLENWDNFNCMLSPDLKGILVEKNLNFSKKTSEKFILGNGISFFERLCFLRGLENTWIDVKKNSCNIKQLLELILNLNLQIIDFYSTNNIDGIIIYDDWGIQDRLMVAPDDWKRIWLPFYQKFFHYAKGKNLHCFFHSCGYIYDIIQPLIDAGISVLELDQQLNIGINKLSEFKGKICFSCSVDTQMFADKKNPEKINSHMKLLKDSLSLPCGGLILKYDKNQFIGNSDEDVIMNLFYQY